MTDDDAFDRLFDSKPVNHNAGKVTSQDRTSDNIYESVQAQALALNKQRVKLRQHANNIKHADPRKYRELTEDADALEAEIKQLKKIIRGFKQRKRFSEGGVVVYILRECRNRMSKPAYEEAVRVARRKFNDDTNIQ